MTLGELGRAIHVQFIARKRCSPRWSSEGMCAGWAVESIPRSFLLVPSGVSFTGS